MLGDRGRPGVASAVHRGGLHLVGCHVESDRGGIPCVAWLQEQHRLILAPRTRGPHLQSRHPVQVRLPQKGCKILTPNPLRKTDAVECGIPLAQLELSYEGPEVDEVDLRAHGQERRSHAADFDHAIETGLHVVPDLESGALERGPRPCLLRDRQSNDGERRDCAPERQHRKWNPSLQRHGAANSRLFDLLHF